MTDETDDRTIDIVHVVQVQVEQRNEDVEDGNDKEECS